MVAPPLPQGRPLAQLVRQLWKEQEAALVATIRQQGAAAFIGFHPEMWFTAFLERVKPIYARYLVDGREELNRRLRTSARVKGLVARYKSARSYTKGVIPLPWVYDQPEPDDEFTIYNPEAVNFINQYAYSFAQSTLATTKLKLATAYHRLRGVLATGIAEGQAIQDITADVMRIFRDPARAMAIATTEVARAYHAGQEIAAKQSGVVSGKRWLASSDACEQCLKLDGKVVALGEPFIVLPEGGPYAVVMYPPLHVRCQCSWTEVLNDEWEP